MSTVKVTVNKRAVADLLKSPEMQADLRRRAEAVANAAGPGHRVDVGVGRNRARAAVITDTHEARVAEATDRNLTRAVDAAR